jgi:hypothetical protein
MDLPGCWVVASARIDSDVTNWVLPMRFVEVFYEIGHFIKGGYATRMICINQRRAKARGTHNAALAENLVKSVPPVSRRRASNRSGSGRRQPWKYARSTPSAA